MHIENKRSLRRDQRGLSTVEYTVLLVLIVAASVGLWSTLGKRVTDRISGSNDVINTMPVPKAKK